MRRFSTNKAATRAIAVAALVTIAGCAETRTYTFRTTPADATIRINGREPIDRSRQQQTTLQFTAPEQVHSIVASRHGFEDASVPITLNTPSGEVDIALRPRVKPITINVEPAAATVLVDGLPATAAPASSLRYDLVFALDSAGQPRPRTLRAERQGFAPAQVQIQFDDASSQYTLRLSPLIKDLTIDTTPSGASLTLDGAEVGTSPVRLSNQPFTYDANNERFVPRAIVASRAGYPPTRFELSWDDGKREYALPLDLYRKTARIATEPADARVTIDGTPVSGEGVRSVPLEFPPIDDAGTLKEFMVEATVDRPGEIWKPLQTTLAWDEGKTAYILKLEEILIRQVPTLTLAFAFANDRWSPGVTPSTQTAYKDLSDDSPGEATRVTDLSAAEHLQIESFAVSPDGNSIVYALLDASGQRPRSRLFLQHLDGTAPTSLTDGRHLDVAPSFSPAGDAVVFSSDRGGGPMQVWSLPLDGATGMTRLTAGNADHLAPNLDTSPRPRVFYEALVPGQDVPRLYSAQVGTTFETDLVATGGRQPRLSPRNDTIAFTQANEQTGRTDLFRAGDRGGVTRNLTNTADDNERDPAWSSDGTRLALTVETRAAPGKPSQTDVYIIGAEGGEMTPVTANPAINDLPAWAPTGDAIYFRSNRGGKWDIWRIDVK